MKKIFVRSIAIVLLVIVLIYGGIIAWFISNETSIVFHPDYTTRSLGTPPDSLHLNFTPVTLTTSDKIALKGWEIISPNADTSATWILFFHGNAGNVSDMGYPQRYAGWAGLGYNTLSMDYRGFGASEGKPTEKGLYIDAQTAYNYLVNEKGVTPSNIVIYGYSLGTGIATELATKVPAKALVLEGAYTSIPDIGAELYPLLPINWMASNKFENKSKIDKINIPVLFLHAKDDAQIPFADGQKLFALAKEPKKFVELTGGHINAQFVDREKMYGELQDFISSIKK